uniref:Golgi-associated plant pathogenesis-related protein 1 n=1 Tax=Cyprinus carpio TaxID=7962 RepID=A0A8C1J0L5_CYPCA
MTKSENLSQFRQSLLEAQNDYRRQHGARPLSLCSVLTKEAQDWAAHLISINALKNSSKGYGETILFNSTDTFLTLGKEVAESWYKENVKYNFANPGFQNGTGRLFTLISVNQLKQVGVGLASDGKGKFITVAFYKPSGNITNPGYFQDNVKPAGR